MIPRGALPVRQRALHQIFEETVFMKQRCRRNQVHDGRVHVSVWGTRPSIEREIKKASGTSRTVVYCGAAFELSSSRGRTRWQGAIPFHCATLLSTFPRCCLKPQPSDWEKNDTFAYLEVHPPCSSRAQAEVFDDFQRRCHSFWRSLMKATTVQLTLQ